jgi:hypothetical protein
MSGKMTDYPRCKACRFWDTLIQTHTPTEMFCECVNPAVRNNTTSDGAAPLGDFFTGPNFGCIHHEPKE